VGRVAYIPDLGEDVIKQYIYDVDKGTLTPAGAIAADNTGKGPFGPRYIEFHPKLPVAYLVNELSSSISVFEFAQSEASLLTSECLKPNEYRETLVQIQNISTIPFAFPKKFEYLRKNNGRSYWKICFGIQSWTQQYCHI